MCTSQKHYPSLDKCICDALIHKGKEKIYDIMWLVKIVSCAY